jgi:serine/threonine-protein kinase
VTSTLPVQGTPLSAGASVNLEVSDGPSPVTVPPVIGNTEQVAESKLTNAGLTPVPKLDLRDDDPANCGIVTNQNPAGNTTAQPGTNVNIDVGDGPECGTSPTTTPATSSVVFSRWFEVFVVPAVFGRVEV